MPTTIGSREFKHASSLYIHVPFCQKKCGYCHFYVIPHQRDHVNLFLNALEKEWHLRSHMLQTTSLLSIYLGGGTPSLLSPEQIEWILSSLLHFTKEQLANLEVTLEVNPETVTFEKMKAFRQAGVNRISLGVQSLNSHLLQSIGRTHSPKTALQAIETSYRAGIDNISIDLMYDLPNQTLHDWNTTLSALKGLPITHLSLYNLTFEPHTAFYKNRKTLQHLIPDEENSLSMYLNAIDSLESLGLMQYEISAFAKEKKYSVHNTGYWLGRPFLGLGPSAFSYWNGERFKNISRLHPYAKKVKQGCAPTDFNESLPYDQKIGELLMVNLRLCEGIHLLQFKKRHGEIPQLFYPIFEQLKNDGYLEISADLIHLTQKGRLFYNTVGESFVK